jgi:putative oxidoreductase
MTTSIASSLIESILRAWMPLRKSLDALQSPVLLIARVYVAWVFFASGLTKLRDWGTTVALFTDEYKVPLLPPAVAAFMGTAGELVLPILLVIGLATRFSALGLFVVNAVAVIALQEIAPAALQQHILWGALLLGIAVFGGGKWTVERRFLGCS